MHKEVSRRAHLDVGRQFTENQKALIDDHKRSKYSLDATSSFNLRPPELVAVTLKEYISWFIRTPNTRKDKSQPCNANLASEPLEDGGGRFVKIRFSHIREVYDYFQTRVQQHERAALLDDATEDIWLNGDQVSVARKFLDNVLKKLVEFEGPIEKLRESALGKNFVDFSSEKRTIATHSAITPYNPVMFTYSMIMIYGKFVTELDFSQQASLKEALIASRVLTNFSPEQCDKLIGRYYEEHLHWESASSGRKCRLMKRCREVLRDLVLNDNINYADMPPILMHQIHGKYTQKAVTFIEEQHHRLVKSLAEVSGIQNFPSVQDLTNRLPVEWNPLDNLVRPGDDEPNYLPEQRTVLCAGMNKLRRIVAVKDRSYIKGLLLMGAPGTGKSFLAYNLVTYALTLGLSAVTTTLTALRACQLGGIWIHSLFCMRPTTSVSNDPNIDAHNCKNGLLKSPEKLALLRDMHVLMIDEIGLLSLQQLTVIDLVLRDVRRCRRAFGGVLVIATGDYCQLPAITGELIWQSQTLFHNVDWFSLSYLVRSMDDRDLQNIINQIRKCDLLEDEIEKIAQKVIEKTTCVNAWDKAPEAFIKVVGKRQAKQELEKKVIQARYEKLRKENAIRAKRGLPMLKSSEFKARDEYQSQPGQWTEAPKRISDKLTKFVRESRTLLVCQGDLMRITRNDPSSSTNSRYSNGQTCRVLDIIPGDDDNETDVIVEVARPGTTEFPEKEKTVVKFSRSYSISTQVGKEMVLARRKQLPLVSHEVFTVHSTQGLTMEGLITCMEEQKNSAYHIWMREQFLTLISRVKSLSTVYFVGTEEQTIKAIRKVLAEKPKSWKAVERWIQINNMIDASPSLEFEDNLPLHASSNALPTDEIPCVYMLVSLRDFTMYHFGLTTNLAERVYMENALLPLPDAENTKGNNIVDKELFGQCFVACYILGRDTHLTEAECYHIRCQLRLRSEQRRAGSYGAYRIMEDYVTEVNGAEDGKQIVLVKICRVSVLDN